VTAQARQEVDHSAPLPLGYKPALDRAVELRNEGILMTWRMVSFIMREYHGFDRSPAWWREKLRGRVEPRPRGNAERQLKRGQRMPSPSDRRRPVTEELDGPSL